MRSRKRKLRRFARRRRRRRRRVGPIGAFGAVETATGASKMAIEASVTPTRTRSLRARGTARTVTSSRARMTSSATTARASGTWRETAASPSLGAGVGSEKRCNWCNFGFLKQILMEELILL